MLKRVIKSENRWYENGLPIILFSFAVYLGNVNRFRLERWDDAYISFRFAKHLAKGAGLTWNSGGAPVEGYTSFLHILVLALTSAIGLNAPVASLLIGVLSVSATTIILIKILQRQFGAIGVLPATLIGLYLIDPVTAVHSASGLETQLFVVILAASLYYAFSFIENAGWRSAIGVALSTFTACLCRPEGVIYGAATYLALGIFIVSAVRKDSGAKNATVRLLAAAGLTVFLGITYALWKYQYFGYLLPNPFYVKSSKFALAGITEVADYLKHLAKWFAPLAAALAFLFLAERLIKRENAVTKKISDALRAMLRDSAARAKFLLILLPPLLALGYYSTIIHEVGGGFRFSYPTYFYFVLFLAVFLEVLTLPAQNSKILRAGILAVALLWLASLVISQKSWQIAPVPPSGFSRYHFQIADALAETALGNRGTIMCDAAGIIPFVSDFNQIDRVGLVDNFLSGRTNPSQSEREAYFWGIPADVYIGYEPPAGSGAIRPEDDPVMRSPYVSEILLKRKLTLIESRIFVQDADLLHARMRRLRDDWILIGELDFPGWQAWQLKSFAYVRRDSPNAAPLAEKLRKIIKHKPEQIVLSDIDTQ